MQVSVLHGGQNLDQQPQQPSDSQSVLLQRHQWHHPKGSIRQPSNKPVASFSQLLLEQWQQAEVKLDNMVNASKWPPMMGSPTQDQPHPPYHLQDHNGSTLLGHNVTIAKDGLANRTNTTPLDLELPMESQMILIVLYTCTTMLAVVGNILVILVFTFGRRSRTDLRTFLINLACADLIMAIFCMPFTFTLTMLKNWVFSAPMCPIVLFMQTVSVTASVCTNMAIGVDRFWVVHFPLKSRFTKSRSKVVIAIIWLVAGGLSSVQLVVGRSHRYELTGGQSIADCVEVWPEPADTWRRAYTFFILVTTYLWPLSILSFTYGFVGVRLWQRTAPGNADQARDAMQLKSKRKVIKMLVVVVALFGICWLPLHVFILTLDFNPELTNYKSKEEERLFIAIYYAVHWLAMSNSFVNPIIYGFLNDSFRHDLKRLVSQWCPCCRWLSCLQADLSRDSTIVRGYSRYDRHNSSSGSGTIRVSDPSRKLLSVRMNGCGKCETELGPQDALLRTASGKKHAPL